MFGRNRVRARTSLAAGLERMTTENQKKGLASHYAMIDAREQEQPAEYALARVLVGMGLSSRYGEIPAREAPEVRTLFAAARAVAVKFKPEASETDLDYLVDRAYTLATSGLAPHPVPREGRR